MLEKPIVIREKEVNRAGRFRWELNSLKDFFDQTVKLFEKEEKYSGHIVHKTKRRTDGYGAKYAYLVIFEKMPRFLWLPRKKCILAFRLSRWISLWNDPQADGKIIINIHDTKRYKELADLLEPIAKKLSENIGEPVILKKQPNVPTTLSKYVD